jgi:hypothetical protein
MKRLFFAGLITCLVGFSSFAADKNVPDVVQSFFKTFKNAQNVNWTEVNDMLRIGFTLNGHQQFAYYSNDDLVVVATEIKTEELPETLKTQLSEYKGYVVTQAYELDKDTVKEYCVVLQSASKHIVLKGKNKWKVYIGENI